MRRTCPAFGALPFGVFSTAGCRGPATEFPTAPGEIAALAPALPPGGTFDAAEVVLDRADADDLLVAVLKQASTVASVLVPVH